MTAGNHIRADVNVHWIPDSNRHLGCAGKQLQPALLLLLTIAFQALVVDTPILDRVRVAHRKTPKGTDEAPDPVSHPSAS